MTGATSPLDLGLWTKVPKYEDVVKDIEKDYKVRLPERTALTFWDSFALSQYRDMVAGLEGAQEGARAHQGMEAAMEEAVGQEEGVTRREMLAFMTQLQAQSSSAAQTLQQNLDQSAQAHRRALQEQGDQFARSLAEESQRAERRERAAQQAAQALREAPQNLAVVHDGDGHIARQRVLDQAGGRVHPDGPAVVELVRADRGAWNTDCSPEAAAAAALKKFDELFYPYYV